MNYFYFILGFLMFFFPGALISLVLNNKHKIISTFIISANLIFFSCFWLNCFNLKINFYNLLIIFVIISIISLYFSYKNVLEIIQKNTLNFSISKNYIILIPVVCVSILFMARAILQAPLPGDVTFRWNFLAMKIIQHGNFHYYPPMTPKDFNIYFYVDAIPPMVSFINIWMLGIASNELLGIQFFVIFQYLLCLYLCFKLTEELTLNKQAPYYATLILASTPLFFFSIYLGQETGLLTISIISSSLFIFQSKKGGDYHSALLVALALAIGGLSREYGLSFIIYALILTYFMRWKVKYISTMCIIFIFLVSPWYIRTWNITGNPFYSINVLGIFPVNSIHNGIMQYYNKVLGWNSGQTIPMIKNIFFNFFTYSTVCALLLLPAMFILKGKIKQLLWAVGLLLILWLYSIGYTAGHIFYSMRVLAPVFCLIATISGLTASKFAKSKIFTGLFWTICLLGCIFEITIPFPFWKCPISRYNAVAFTPPYMVNNQIFSFQKILPEKAKVLSENANFHAILSMSKKSKISIIPVWSPNVRFLFQQQLSFADASKKLKSQHIEYIIYSLNSLNSRYLKQFPFYKNLKLKAIPIAWNKNNILYKIP